MQKQYKRLHCEIESLSFLHMVSQIPKRLEEFIEVLKKEEWELTPQENIKGGDLSYNEAQKELINDLSWLLKASAAHASIDTFAKKLYLRRDNKNLVRLKLALSVFSFMSN